MTDEMANELEKLQQDRDLINKKLAGKLDELAKRLAAGRRQFDQQAAEPLEYFEAVFPLMADQQRFVMLVLWQQDLAERLASLKGRDGKDNPALKAAHARPGAGAGADPRSLGQAARRHPGAQPRDCPRMPELATLRRDGGEVR